MRSTSGCSKLRKKRKKNETEVLGETKKTRVMIASHPMMALKRKIDALDITDDAADGCSKTRKKVKVSKEDKAHKKVKISKEDKVQIQKKVKISKEDKAQKKVNKGGLKTVMPPSRAAPVSPDSQGYWGCSSSSRGNPKDDVTIDKPKQMKFISNALDKLKNVPDITEMIDDNAQMTTEVSSSSEPPMVSEGIGYKFQTVNFYWLDMVEDPEHPGVLFIFGKVKSPPPGNGYSNGCVVVRNCNRHVFLLPRQTKADGKPVDYMDVYNEFYTVFAPKLKIPWFQCKRSQRKYCFDTEGIPPVAEYMEVRYSGTAPALPQDVNGKTFSHAFGTNTTLMETFLLDRKLKGPCWLQLSYCEQVPPDQQKSWSKFEFTCDVSSVKIHPDSSKFPTPTLVLASIKTETSYDAMFKETEIIFAGVAVSRNFNLKLPLPPSEICHDFFCLLNIPPGQLWPLGVERVTNKRILKMDSEWSLLESLVSKLDEIDADIYLGFGLKLDRLLNRLWDLDVPNWSRIGRLKRSTPTPVTKSCHELNSHHIIHGRLLCDVNNSEVVETVWTRTFNPTGLFSEHCPKKRDGVVALFNIQVKKLFESPEGIELFVKWGMKHCVLNILETNELEVLPLAFQMTCIAGNTLSQALLENCCHQSEYLMLHALSSKDYIVPDEWQAFQKKGQEDVEDNRQNSQRIELTSVEGFYDSHVLVLGFSSEFLFLSAIQELNTFSRVTNEWSAEELRATVQMEIRKLGENWKQLESLMSTELVEDEASQYDIRQKALVWTMVSAVDELRGDSRFHSKTLKAYVQEKIQEMLLEIKQFVGRMGFEVIYGNQSSVMINMRLGEISTVLEIERTIKEQIKQTYPLLPVDTVAIYRSLLLLKNNKYAGLLYTPGPISKSTYELDLEHFAMGPSGEVPIIVSKTAHACLSEVLSDHPISAKIYEVGKVLWDVSSRLRNETVPVNELLISKILTNNPEEFENIEGLHHVLVALRMNRSETFRAKFRKGDQVSYVMCIGGHPCHLSELDHIMQGKTANVIPDADYYLAQMIRPVSELCQQIPGLGFDRARVADALGCTE